MNKKGQVTIFIIIAVIIIAIAGIYFAFKENFSFGSPNPEVAPISNFVQECVYNTGIGGLYFLAPTAGYFEIPKLSSEDGLAYYLIGNKSYFPSKEILEKELDKYIEGALYYCTNEFENFPEFNITEGDITSNSQINEKEVILNVEYPIIIRKNESIYTIKKFNDIEISYRYGEINSAIHEIINSFNEEGTCINCISSIAEKYAIKIDMTNTDYGVIFSISDNSPLGFEDAFKFKFMVDLR